MGLHYLRSMLVYICHLNFENLDTQMSNEVINASHLLPDPKCTCSRFGFPGEYPGTFLFLFVICELIFLNWTIHVYFTSDDNELVYIRSGNCVLSICLFFSFSFLVTIKYRLILTEPRQLLPTN